MTACMHRRCARNTCACLSTTLLEVRICVPFWVEEHTFKLEGEVVGQVTTLVVAAKEKKGFGIPDFERPEVEHALQDASDDRQQQPRNLVVRRGVIRHANTTYLNAEVAPVNIVSQEQIACRLRIASDLEKLHQIILRCRRNISKPVEKCLV